MTSVTGTRNTPRLGAADVAVLQGIQQHRLLSTVQVQALHAPDRSTRSVQHTLARLRQADLVAMARRPRGSALWHLTEAGADAVEDITDRIETRRKVLGPDNAVGALLAHTLAVNDVGIAFVEAARDRGDECGPFAWRHEIAHSLGPPPGRRAPEQLIADAVLTYQLEEPDGETSFVYRFIELDRGTRAADDLAARLARYARLYRRTIPADTPGGGPARLWAKLYPVFPTILVVLTGRARHLLQRRCDTVLALCRQHPDLADTQAVEISICLLDDLQALGPFAPICRTTADPDRPVDWLGQSGPKP
jgi:hypothetical protein